MLKLSELTLADRERFTALTDHIPVSFYHFTNMYVWREPLNLRWCEIENSVCVFIEYRPGHPLMYFPLGENVDLGKIARIVHAEFPHIKKIHPVWKEMLDSFGDLYPGINPQENRNSFDYVYSYEQLTALSGSKYHAKKNHVNQFFNRYDYKYTEITGENIDMLISASQALYVPDGGELDQEFLTIGELIKNFSLFSLHAAVITVGERYAAYSIGEKITGGSTALIHIEKADRGFTGSFATINYLFLKNSFAGCEFVNREEDMGKSGLRKAKTSYHPIFFNEVYEITLSELLPAPAYAQTAAGTDSKAEAKRIDIR